jgi:L,D-transpeptidase ErfK/SrfK
MIAILLAFLISAVFSAASFGQPLQASNSLMGGQTSYTVQKGDSLTHLGARFGIDVSTLAALNGLKPTARLQPGQVLHVDNRHVVLRELDDGIVINVPQRMLFYFKSGKLIGGYPIGVGRPRWPTPVGEFQVTGKEKNKTWIVPESIQEEMLLEGKPVREVVPPGPKNPLGEYWLRISPSCGIHGTIAPPSVYKFQSHGCIRLLPDNIAKLFEEVPVGTLVKVVYEPVLLARLPNGKLYLEVHRDVYRKAEDPLTTVKQIAAAAGIDSMLDWQNVERVIKERRGVACEVSLSIPAA